MNRSYRTRRSSVGAAVAVIVLMIPLALPAARAEESEPGGPAWLWDEVRQLYQRAKEAGEQVPKDVYEWARRDVQRIGDWEYQVVDVDAKDPAAVQARLNDLGQERWECIWIESGRPKLRLYMKRPVRSYLSHLPVSQLMKLLPAAGATGDTGG